jgi:hypothetical protein
MRRAKVVVAATTAVLAAGCAIGGDVVEATPPGIPTAVPTVVSSTSSGSVASPSANPAPGGVEPGRIAEIVTTDLIVRSLPEISGASLVDPVKAPMGSLAYIVDGPIEADGYDWYQVAVFLPVLSDVVEPLPGFGWLAGAAKDGEPWIAPWDGDCPKLNTDGIVLSPRYVALACWGRSDVTLEGTLSNCGDYDEPTGEPAWLFTPACVLGVPGYDLVGGLFIWFAPEVQSPLGNGARVRVIGHLDDPAASDCTEEPPAETEPKQPELVALGCRLRFVVTVVTEI